MVVSSSVLKYFGSLAHGKIAFPASFEVWHSHMTFDDQ